LKLPSFIIPSTPARDATAHLAHVQKLYESYPYRTYDQCRAAMAGIMSKICKRFPEQIADEFGEAVFSTLHHNNVFFLEAPDDTDPDFLQRLQHIFTTPDWPSQGIQAAVVLFREFYKRLPPSVFEESGSTMRVPLYELIENVPNLIMMLSAHSAVKRGGVPVFRSLNKRLEWNCIEASGYTLDGYDGKPLTHAFESKLTGAELIHTYLRGTGFEKLLTLHVPFVIPRKTWASHAIILAPPGHGKTQLLGSLLSGFLQDDDDRRVGCFVLDPHGDLYNDIALRIPKERLVSLDPDTDPPPLNFLDFGTSTEAQTLQTFSYLMSSLSGGLSDKQGAIVPYLLKLLRKIPDASLETLRLIVDEKVRDVQKSQFSAAINALPTVDQGFFHNQFYNARMQETKDAIGWKLYSALSSDTFRQMFSPNKQHATEPEANKKTSRRQQNFPNSHGSSIPHFDADACMRERKTVIVKGGRQSLGDEGMSVFLQFIVAQFFAAALRRESMKPEHRHLCVLMIDEAHHVFNPQIAKILAECRKYCLGLVAATQVLQQIPDDVKAAVYGATAIKITGPVAHTDAVLLSREMYTTTDFIRSMRARERKDADWAVYVQNVTPRAIRVTVPYGQLEAMPKLEKPPVTAASQALAPPSGMRPEGASPNIPQTKEPPQESGPTSTKASHEAGNIAHPGKTHDPDAFPEKW
jgi:hypothetical protein